MLNQITKLELLEKSQQVIVPQSIYHRLGIFSVEEIMPLIQTREKSGGKPKISLLGYNVNVGSLRLQTFKQKGTDCIFCGFKGKFFALEYAINNPAAAEHPHLNLYGNLLDGTEIILTHDHIIPKSAGGKDFIDNTQTACYRCNFAKDSSEVIF
jgi:hypothetical protein